MLEIDGKHIFFKNLLMNDHELKITSDIPRRPTEMVTIFKNAASLALAAL